MKPFKIKETKMKVINLRNVIIIVLLIGMGTGFAQASKLEVLEVLSKKEAEFEFKDVDITEALDKIGHVARVEVVLSDEAEWKLPQGQTTRLSASLKGSLADCLTEMLNTFFMRYAVSDEMITIYPQQELKHILGRPSNKQLELLKKIYTMRMSFSGRFNTENIVDLISGAFEGVSFLPHTIPIIMSEICETMSTDKGMAPVYFVALLEQVCDKSEWSTWYISGMDFPNQFPLIKLVDEVEYREAVLDQIVDISFEGRRADRADVILKKLAGWTGMDLLILSKDSPWLEEKISVNMQNIKLKQALINIVDSLGGQIEINIRENWIRLYAPVQPRKKESTSEKAKSVKSSGEGYVGKISIPIGEGEDKYFIEFMLREKDLTEELRKLRENKIKQILKKFSKIDSSTVEVTFNPQSYTILN
jgi:hypothetical protein